MSTPLVPTDVVGLGRLLIETLDAHALARAPRERARIWATVVYYRDKLRAAHTRLSPVATRGARSEPTS
jgi:hypothetical protein